MGVLGKIVGGGALLGFVGGAADVAGQIYSADQQAKAVTKTNEANALQAAAEREFNAAEAEKGRLFSAEQMREANTFSASQAQKQMDFQKEMSNTSYQRATADMRAAGLNPMLAYDNGGASSPSGSSASSAMASSPVASGGKATMLPVPSRMMNIMSSARDMVRMLTDLRGAVSSWNNVDADTLKKGAETAATLQDAGLTSARKAAQDFENERRGRQMEFERKWGKTFSVLDAINQRIGLVNSAAMIGKKTTRNIPINDSGPRPVMTIDGD